MHTERISCATHDAFPTGPLSEPRMIFAPDGSSGRVLGEPAQLHYDTASGYGDFEYGYPIEDAATAARNVSMHHHRRVPQHELVYWNNTIVIPHSGIDIQKWLTAQDPDVNDGERWKLHHYHWNMFPEIDQDDIDMLHSLFGPRIKAPRRLSEFLEATVPMAHFNGEEFAVFYAGLGNYNPQDIITNFGIGNNMQLAGQDEFYFSERGMNIPDGWEVNQSDEEVSFSFPTMHYRESRGSNPLFYAHHNVTFGSPSIKEVGKKIGKMCVGGVTDRAEYAKWCNIQTTFVPFD